MRIQKIFTALIFVLIFSGCAMVPISFPPPPFTFEPKEEYPRQISYSAENAKFFAGFAKRVITPKKTVWLAGKAPRHGTKTVGDLWVRCLVLADQNRNSVAVVSLDLLGLMPSDVRDIQKQAKTFLNGKILIHSTHTHSAPDTMGLWGPRLLLFLPIASGRDENYIRALKKEVTKCIFDATNNQKPAMITFSSSLLEDIARGPRDMKNDESFFVMQAITHKERILLINFAVHPETVKQDYITADFLHYVYDYLGTATGNEIIYVNGAIGGVQPRGMPGRENDWLNAQKIAKAIIHKTIAVMPNARLSESSRISWSTKTIRLKPENALWTIATFLGFLPEERDENGKIPIELNYLRIGDAGVITFPGEVFPNIALQLKNKMPDVYKIAFGLTNGELGYFLFSRDVRSGKYKYHSRVSAGPHVGDEIFKKLNILIQREKETKE